MKATEQPSNPATQLPLNKRAGHRPDWLKIRVPSGLDQLPVSRLMHDLALNTVCQEARCPNIFECWSAGTATFMVLGEICTRSEEHTSELQSQSNLVCRLLLEKKNTTLRRSRPPAIASLSACASAAWCSVSPTA